MSNFCCWLLSQFFFLKKRGAQMTQHEQFPRTNDDFMQFSVLKRGRLFVLVGFDLCAVPTANTSDSISENNLLNS